MIGDAGPGPRRGATPAGEFGLGRYGPALLVGTALIVGVLAGLRPPGRWAATHLVFDYELGFIKRGLVGQVLSLLVGGEVEYLEIVISSAVMLSIWIFLLVYLIVKLGRSDNLIYIVASVYFVSPGFYYPVHMIGCLDIFSMICVLTCFALPANLSGLLARFLICVVGAFAHEAFIPMFLPVVAFQYYLAAPPRRRPFSGLELLLASLLVLLSLLLVQHTAPSELEPALRTHLQERAVDFELREDAVAVLFRDSAANLELMRIMWGFPRILPEIAFSLLLVVSTSIFFAFVAWRALKDRIAAGPRRVVAGLMLVAVIAGPLSLDLIAWDVWRYAALTQTTAFFAILAVTLRHGDLAIEVDRRAGLLFCLAFFAVVGASLDPPFFDGYAAVKPPFFPHLDHLYDVLKGRTPFLSVPQF